MPFAAYNSSGVRLLSGVLADAMISARKTIGRQLSETEASELNKRLVRSLAEAHDSGERNPGELKRAAARSAFQWKAEAARRFLHAYNDETEAGMTPALARRLREAREIDEAGNRAFG